MTDRPCTLWQLLCIALGIYMCILHSRHGRKKYNDINSLVILLLPFIKTAFFIGTWTDYFLKTFNAGIWQCIAPKELQNTCTFQVLQCCKNC